MKAVNHYLIIERIKDGPTKVGGLILTEETDEDNRYLKAKVISIGNNVEGIKEENRTKISYVVWFCRNCACRSRF